MPRITVASPAPREFLAPRVDGFCFTRAHQPCRTLEAAYHHDVLMSFRQTIAAAKATASLAIQAEGGGRIRHSAAEKEIAVYGYSVAFGQGDNKAAAALVRTAFPSYPAESVTWSLEGY